MSRKLLINLNNILCSIGNNYLQTAVNNGTALVITYYEQFIRIRVNVLIFIIQEKKQ